MWSITLLHIPLGILCSQGSDSVLDLMALLEEDAQTLKVLVERFVRAH